MAFAKMIRSYKAALEDYGILETTKNLLEETGYLEEIKNSDEDDAQERIENIEEFISRIAVFEEENPEGTLSQLLEEVALVSDLDNADSETSRVLLMTVHSGLMAWIALVYAVTFSSNRSLKNLL